MKQTYFYTIKRISPRLILLVFVFCGINANAQDQASKINGEKPLRRAESKIVIAPNEIALDQVTGRIVKLQEMLSNSGVTKPTEKLLHVMPSMCPDIAFSAAEWPNADLLRKTNALHFDQGEKYLELLINLHQDINTDK